MKRNIFFVLVVLPVLFVFLFYCIHSWYENYTYKKSVERMLRKAKQRNELCIECSERTCYLKNYKLPK